MEIAILNDNACARFGADLVEDLLQRKPTAVLGLATGASPLGVYRELGRRVAKGTVNLSGITAFTLDEYLGLPADHPERYRNVILREFANLVGVSAENIHTPDDSATDLDAACEQYERDIARAGGIDLQILGIGTDGHIAFNGPGSSLGSRTRLKALSKQTRIDNARYFDDALDKVPTHCITQGLATILDARHIVLLAEGVRKARAVVQLVDGPVSARWPASILQMHPRVTVILDQSAAQYLRDTDYYQRAFASRAERAAQF